MLFDLLYIICKNAVNSHELKIREALYKFYREMKENVVQNYTNAQKRWSWAGYRSSGRCSGLWLYVRNAQQAKAKAQAHAYGGCNGQYP